MKKLAFSVKIKILIIQEFIINKLFYCMKMSFTEMH